MRIVIYAADETGASGIWSGATDTPYQVKVRVIDSTDKTIRNVSDETVSDKTWSVTYTLPPPAGTYTCTARLLNAAGKRLASQSVMFTVA